MFQQRGGHKNIYRIYLQFPWDVLNWVEILFLEGDVVVGTVIYDRNRARNQ